MFVSSQTGMCTEGCDGRAFQTDGILKAYVLKWVAPFKSVMRSSMVGMRCFSLLIGFVCLLPVNTDSNFSRFLGDDDNGTNPGCWVFYIFSDV